MAVTMDLRARGPAFLEFWRERHLCSLTTVRPDGTAHVVPVGVTLEPAVGLARVITMRGSRKVALVAARGAFDLTGPSAEPGLRSAETDPEGMGIDSELSVIMNDGAGVDGPPRRRGGARVAVCQIDGGRWSTLEGLAVVRDEPAAVAEAERRYAERYRTPRVNPQRVVLEISVTRVLGTL
ncbi:pyridoxamine 5'-phosphate oxidase family protein [Parafrankia elaeagni]|uniref:pyridoxamine 5'-phosphate oxidase family protein n=1 Tax=Parafrankia elaeagni TaxID=222534 RepID=UPI00036BCEDF|nr:pyridoxamine 5'-phosphate oxidase family protein [Parafrankia elaeagni]